MNPYFTFTERVAGEHRDDLLRAAEASRFVHPAENKARSQWWQSLLLRLRFGRQKGRITAPNLPRDAGSRQGIIAAGADTTIR